MLHIRRNLGQRLQHEATQMHARVWDLQLRSVDHGFPVEQHIHVDQARAFGNQFPAAHLRLNFTQPMQQLHCSQFRFHFNSTIQKPRLVHIIDRLRFIRGRDSCYAHPCIA